MGWRRVGRCGGGAAALSGAWALAFFVTAGASPPVSSAVADAPDAVIETWEQGWALRPDGATVYEEKRHVRLNHERAYGEFADPRILFNKGTDDVELRVARTRRPDGSYVEVPAYSRNEVSPRGAAGWPAYAGLRQLVVTMSAIEPGCVVELEYRVVRRSEGDPCLSGDVRLDHRYPVRQRKLRVEVPRDVELSHEWIGIDAGRIEPSESGGGGDGRRIEFTVRDLAAVEEEPQSPPWQTHCARFRFSTAGGLERWLTRRLEAVEAAAKPSEATRGLAEAWAKQEQEPLRRLKAVQERLAATFNFVELDADWWRGRPRPAADVLNGNYGVGDEAAAALLALARPFVAAQPAVLVDDETWSAATAGDGDVLGTILAVYAPNGMQFWDPQRGRLHRVDVAGRSVLLVSDGKVARQTFAPWTSRAESRMVIEGKAALTAEGKWSGTLRMETSGLFCSPRRLETSEGQRARVEELVRRVLPEAAVKSVTVKSLTDEQFVAEAQVESGKALEQQGGAWVFSLSPDPPFLADVPMPLTVRRRSAAVRLSGAFEERVDLALSWPERWTVEARPMAVNAAGAEWGAVQQVEPRGGGLRISRRVWSGTRAMAAEPYGEFVRNVNEVRSEAARTLMVRAR